MIELKTISEIKKNIQSYFELGTPKSLLLHIATSTKPNYLSTALHEMLNSNKWPPVLYAHVFIQDLHTQIHQKKYNKYIKAIVNRKIISTVKKHGTSKSYQKSVTSIGTLGKIGSKETSSALLSLFSNFIDKQPFQLYAICNVMIILQNFPAQSFIESMISSKNFYSRWAALPLIDNLAGSKITKTEAKKYYLKLSDDPISYIQKEAKLYLRELSNSKISRNPNILLYDQVEAIFPRYLSYKKKNHYTLKDLDCFTKTELPKLLDKANRKQHWNY